LWLAENPKIQPAATIIVHTRNADAAIRMVEIMRQAGRQVEYIPFPMLEQRIKNYWRS
jgi:uroporphyrinogen-III synthase